MSEFYCLGIAERNKRLGAKANFPVGSPVGSPESFQKHEFFSGSGAVAEGRGDSSDDVGHPCRK
jgi:hypothetical protein